MNRIRPKSVLASVLLSVALASQAFALDVGSDGLSGVLNPVVTTQIDLSLATTGDLADPGRVNGTYDPVRWAVIFKYSSVTIPSGSIVTFKNHPSGAPVVWLVQGNVTISSGAALKLDGSPLNVNLQICQGGPGGFAGARGGSIPSYSAGTGPGGGDTGKDGSYATNGSGSPVTGRTYGNPGILPLVGGSGGGGGEGNYSGGGGGGAILIAANGTITVGGTNCISAIGTARSGASGAGSGGAVRLLATAVVGGGSITAIGGQGYGGLGRIRIEANTILIPPGATPPYSTVAPLTGNELLFPDASAPTVRVSAVNGQAVSPTPNGELNALADLTLSTVLPITVDLVSANVPVGSTVTLRVVPVSGAPASYTATSTGSNTWQVASVVLPSSGVAQMQAKAVLP